MRDYIGTGKNSDEKMVEELINGRPTKTVKKATWPSDKDVLTSKKYKTTLSANQLIISDTETKAVSGYAVVTQPDSLVSYNSGGTSSWKFSLDNNETKTIRFAMTWDDNEEYRESNAETRGE
jgi:hypothetical protein